MRLIKKKLKFQLLIFAKKLENNRIKHFKHICIRKNLKKVDKVLNTLKENLRERTKTHIRLRTKLKNENTREVNVNKREYFFRLEDISDPYTSVTKKEKDFKGSYK